MTIRGASSRQIQLWLADFDADPIEFAAKIGLPNIHIGNKGDRLRSGFVLQRNSLIISHGFTVDLTWDEALGQLVDGLGGVDALEALLAQVGAKAQHVQIMLPVRGSPFQENNGFQPRALALLARLGLGFGIEFPQFRPADPTHASTSGYDLDDVPIIDAQVPYWDLAQLADYYFEDSYVITIQETGNSLAFELLVVLREAHPAYAPPKPNEQYCYADATLLFAGVTRAHWFERSWSSSVDADGTLDMGNIHSLRADGRGGYLIEGDWGSVAVRSDMPRINIGQEAHSDQSVRTDP